MSHCLAPLLSFRPTERSEGSRGTNAKRFIVLPFSGKSLRVDPSSFRLSLDSLGMTNRGLGAKKPLQIHLLQATRAGRDGS
jgi:hypothetical protein